MRRPWQQTTFSSMGGTTQIRPVENDLPTMGGIAAAVNKTDTVERARQFCAGNSVMNTGNCKREKDCQQNTCFKRGHNSYPTEFATPQTKLD